MSAPTTPLEAGPAAPAPVRRPGATRQMLRSPLGVVVVVVVLWFSAAFLVLPNLSLLQTTFAPEGRLTLTAFDRLLSSERALRSLRNSVLLAATLAVTVNVVGIFIVLVTGWFRVRARRVLWLGFATTFIYGGIVLAAGYSFIYGRYGFVTNALARSWPDLDRDWFSGFVAVVLVMTFATTTNHMLFLSAALASIDHQSIEAARLMGASTATILRRIVLPALRPMVFAVTVLTFLTGLGALTAPLVLGGEDFQTVAPMILTFARSTSSRDVAALLAVLLGLATIALLAVMNRVERGGTYFAVAKVAVPIAPQAFQTRWGAVVVQVLAWALWAVYVFPVLCAVVFSFVDARAIMSGSIGAEDLTLEHWTTVLTSADALGPFVVSVVYSGLASLVVVFGLVLVARSLSRWRGWLSSVIEYVLHIPWILPTILIALGLVMTYDEPRLLVVGQVLTGTVVLLGVAYVVVKIPFTLRLLKAAFAAVPDELEDAARILGAGQLTTVRRVVLPLIAPTMAAVTALNFTSLLDDYDAAVFLYHPLFEPLGIAIKQSTEGEANVQSMGITFVYTVLLMLVQGLVLWLVYGRGSTGARRRG
ncbi:ABC transporter permease [Auraticoccus monumenti]|uniref:Iron(III) transport system permease protein n=1 Tax=Auraticoccus monumenti TaxID=675864 RepID=A0A1G7DBZ1_9ACTN|nr:iron ABC transporter permease [Auraticoccus monumenti]SDE49019.1 iron(III) transport system permease protein [Auraticoccus monumenti]